MILQEGNWSRVIFKRDNNYRKYSHDDNSWDRVLCVLAAQLADRPLSGLINGLARHMNGETFQPHEIPLCVFLLLFSFHVALVTSKEKIVSVRH